MGRSSNRTQQLGDYDISNYSFTQVGPNSLTPIHVIRIVIQILYADRNLDHRQNVLDWPEMHLWFHENLSITFQLIRQTKEYRSSWTDRQTNQQDQKYLPSWQK